MPQRQGDYEEQDHFLGVVGDHDRVAELSEQRRFLPMALITAAAMAVFAGGLWFAYVQGTHHGATSTITADGNVPLIRADQRPVKVKPDQPGGMEVPDRDKLVFNEKTGGPPVEKLLPPAEKPEPLPAPQPKAVISFPPIPAPPSLSATPTPIIEAMPKPEPDAPAQPKVAATKPAPAKPAATPKPAAVTATPVSAAGATAGSIKVQLGSLRSPEAARDEWQRLKQGNSDLLGRFTAVAVRAEVPDKGTYYRIEAGPVGDAAAAGRLCGELKKRNLGCTIAR
jgi:cell division septation protein DedD